MPGVLCCGFLGLGLMGTAGYAATVGGQERPLITHGPIKGELELGFESLRNTQSGGAVNRNSDARIIKERVRVATEGDVYHANLLTYSVMGGVGLSQSRLSSNDRSMNETDTLDEYNAVFQFLKMKPYPMTLLLNKSDDLISRPYQGPLQSEKKSTGFAMSLRSLDLPMRFQYTVDESNQYGLANPSQDNYYRKDERFRYSVEHEFSKLSHLSYDYERNDITRRNADQKEAPTTENRHYLKHDLTFGPNDEYKLDSSLNYYEQQGTEKATDMLWEEYLEIQHTPSLRTHYELRYNTTQQTDLQNKSLYGNVGFIHQLYESLTTTGDVFMARPNLDSNIKTEQQGESLGFNYRKTNPLGNFLATYNVNHITTNQSGGTGSDFVFREKHVVPGTPAPEVELNHVGIEISSIVVEDALGDAFTQGLDYAIYEINGRIRLRIFTIGGGATPNFTAGQDFYVTYVFQIESQRNEEMWRQYVSLEQQFDNGISVFFRHRRQDETITSTQPGIVPDQSQRNTFGTRYDKSGLSLLAEHSIEDSTIQSNTNTLLEGSYSWIMDPDTRATLRALKNDLAFSPDPRDVTTYNYVAELSRQLSNRYILTSRVDYRDETDTEFGKTKGFELRSELKYLYRQVYVIVGVEYDMLDRNNDKTNEMFFYMKLKRFF
jgi:hypothetical protein